MDIEQPPPSSSTVTKVKVAVRLRPLIDKEKKEGSECHWECGRQLIQQIDPETNRTIGVAPHVFDHVFGSDTKTEEVYHSTVAPIVEDALKGFNGTILCYGQTSSGKTYTLYGDEKEPGIITLTANHLFTRIKDDSSRQYLIRVGLIEIYNEKITDLLNSENPIEIVEQNGQVVPKDLEEIQIIDSEGMLKAAQRVQRERKIGETRMNKESSRSHTILRISIESVSNKDTNDPDDLPSVTNALLNFVDLAGSEKASQTGATGNRLKESAFINRSLSTLSLVVMQLSEEFTGISMEEYRSGYSSCSSTSKKPRHVKFRDSKLTRILQSSLVGNAYIAMICNVTPAYLEETLSTLRFAKAAKKIQVKPQKNQMSTDKSQYEKVISELQCKLEGKTVEAEALRKQLAVFSKMHEPFAPLSSTLGSISMIDRRKTVHILPSCIANNPEKVNSETIFSIKNALSNKLKSRSERDLHTIDEHREFSARTFGETAIQTEINDNSKELQMLVKRPIEFEKESVECQTSFCENELSPPPMKKPRHFKELNNETPKSILRLGKQLLEQTIEDDKCEWYAEKEFQDNEIKIIKLERDQLQSDLTTEKGKWERTESEIKNLKERLSSKDYEVDVLFKQNQAKTKLIQELRSELQNLQSVTANETNICVDESLIGDHTVANLQDELQEVREKLQSLLGEIQVQTEFKEKLESELGAKVESQKLLEKENQTYLQKIEVQDNVIAEGQRNIEKYLEEKKKTELNLNEVLTKFEKDKMDALEETANSKQQLSNQSIKLQELEDNFAKLSQEQLKSQKLIEDLEKELENQRAVNEQKCEVVGNLEKELDVLRAEKDAVLDQIAESQRNLEKKLEEKKTTELSLNETNELLKKLEKDKMDALEETANSKQQLSNQNIKLQELEDNFTKSSQEKLESRKQIEALEKELENQRSINEEKCEVVGNLEKELDVLRAEKETVLDQIAESQRNLEKKLEEQKKTELRLTEMNELLKRLEKDKMDALEETANNKQQLSKQNIKLQELEDNFTKLSQEKLESRKQIEALEKELENQRTMNERKCEVAGNSDASLFALESELKILRAYKDTTLDQIAESKRNFEKCLEEKEKTELRLNETNELLKKLEKDKLDALEEIVNNKQLLSNQNSKLQELEDDFEKLSQEKLESRKQIEALEKELKNQRFINERKCEVAGNLDASLIALESELKIVRADKEIALSQIAESKRNFEKCLEEKKIAELRLNETNELLKKLEKDKIDALEEIDNNKQLLSNQNTKLQELEDNFEKLSQEKLESRKQIEGLKKELENQGSINEEKCEVVGNLEKELDVLRAEKETVLKQIAESQTNLEKKLEEKKKTELRLNETNELLKSLEKDKMDALEETANNKQQLSKQNIKLQELEDNFTKLSQEKLESQKQIEALEKELDNQRTVNERKCQVAGSLEASMFALEAELKILRADKETSLAQIKEMTESQIYLEKYVKEKENTEISLNERFKQLEKEKVDLYGELSRNSSKLQEIMDEKQKMERDHQSNTERLKADITTLKTDLETQKRDLIHLENRTGGRKVLVNRSTETTGSVDILIQLREYKIHCKVNEKKLENQMKTLEQLKKDHQKEISVHESKIQASELECGKLRNSLCFIEKEKEDLRNSKRLVDSQIQCDYLTELVKRSNKGEIGILPNEFPDLALLQNENSDLRAANFRLQSGRMKCKCKEWKVSVPQGPVPVEKTRSTKEFNYKEYLESLKVKAAVQNSPPRKYNTRSTAKLSSRTAANNSSVNSSSDSSTASSSRSSASTKPTSSASKMPVLNDDEDETNKRSRVEQLKLMLGGFVEGDEWPI